MLEEYSIRHCLRLMQYDASPRFPPFYDILSLSCCLCLLFRDLSQKLAFANWSPSRFSRGAGISNRMKLHTSLPPSPRLAGSQAVLPWLNLFGDIVCMSSPAANSAAFASSASLCFKKSSLPSWLSSVTPGPQVRALWRKYLLSFATKLKPATATGWTHISVSGSGAGGLIWAR